MPEDKTTGQASKPEPKPEEPKPSTPSSEEPVQGNEGKARGRRFVKYQDLSKDELIRMLMRINKRLSRISRELREVTDILYYGYTQGAPQSEGQYRNNSGYRSRRNNKKDYGRYGYKGSYRQKRSEDEDVNYE